MRVFFITLLTVLLLATAGQAKLFEDQILDRDRERVFMGVRSYPVTVISNVPENDIMPLLCKQTLLRRDGDNTHCDYLPLANVGGFGKRKRDLLPYDVASKVETVIAVERDTLTPAEAERLDWLRRDLFPLATQSKTKDPCVNLWIQNTGYSGKEYQVVIDVPSREWLESAVDDLWALSSSTVPDFSNGHYSMIRPIGRAAILTNDAKAREWLESSLRYTTTRIYTLDDFDRFRDDTTATRRFLALNWNGPEECTAAMAAQILPTSLREECRKQTPDRMGLTGWQRFCRRAFAQRYQNDVSDTWVISAPTAALLETLVGKVADNRFTGGPYTLDICDLSHIQSLAVGVYVDSPDPDRRRLVMQQRLEEAAEPYLRSKLRSMVSTQNWGDVLNTALGRDPSLDDPFRRPDDQHMVNQASNTDGVLLLWVKTLDPVVKYTFPVTRLTPAYPGFGEAEPDRPSEPNPDDRRYGIAGPHVYPGETTEDRRASEAYRHDYAVWRDEEMPRYDRAHSAWERHKRDWEYDSRDYRVKYEYVVTATPTVTLTGYLRVLDMYGNQRVLWSREVTTTTNGNRYDMRRIPVNVIGDRTDPPLPPEVAMYRNCYSWHDADRTDVADALYAVGQTSILTALRDGIATLASDTLWSTDLQPWNQPVSDVVDGAGAQGNGVGRRE